MFLIRTRNITRRNLSQTFEDASNGGSGSGDDSLQSNDTSLVNLVRFITEYGLLPGEFM